MAISNPALLEMLRGAKNKYSRSTGKIVKLKEGKTTIRILQADPEKPFWQDLGVHWIKAGQNEKPVAVVGCHDVVHEMPCPVCTAVEQALKSAVDDDSVKIIKEWKSRKSVLIAALIRSGSDASDEPQIVEITPTTFGNILSVLEEYASEGNVLDPEDGIDFVIERSGKGLDTRYTVMPAARSKPVPEGVMEKIPDLKEFVEKEFFRGEDTKALNGIASITGINIRSLTGPRGTSLLTSRAGTVEDAVVEDAPAAKAPVYSEVDPPFDVDDAPASKTLKPKPAAAKPAPAEKPEPKPAEETTDFNSALSEDELNALIGELDDI